MSDDANDSHSARKVTKITSACERCREKKRKCNGERPTCAYCAAGGAQCVYASRQKTRGPVAGYLRNVERRVAWLESIIAHLSLTIWDDGPTPGAIRLKDKIQSFIRHEHSDNEWKALQDVYKRDFKDITTAATSESDRGPSVSGVKRTIEEREGTSSDPAQVSRASRSNEESRQEREEFSLSADTPGSWANLFGTGVGSVAAVTGASLDLPESSMRFQNHNAPQTRNYRHLGEPAFEFNPMDLDTETHSYMSNTGSILPAQQSTLSSRTNMVGANSLAGAFSSPIGGTHSRPIEMIDSSSNLRTQMSIPEALLSVNTDVLSTSISRQAFDLDYDSTLRQVLDAEDVLWCDNALQSSFEVQLPPKPVQNALIHIHLQFVHPILPFLDVSKLSAYASADTMEAVPPQGASSRALILALCAYAASISPNLGSLASGIGQDINAGGSLPELWAEESRSTLLSSTLRRRCGIEAIQTIILLVLRDHGNAQNYQSWLWLGIAIRLAQDIRLHQNLVEDRLDPENYELRKNVWTTLCFMDVMLSLQLERPSCVEYDGDSFNRMYIGDESRSTGFRHLLGLCHLLHDIRRTIYGLHKPSDVDVLAVRSKLQKWKAALPDHLKGILGEDVTPDAALLLMIYQMAVLLAWRPLEKAEGSDASRPIALATTAFKVLLEGIQSDVEAAPGFLRCCPQAIYGVFTVAISLISTIRQFRSVSSITQSTKATSSILTARVSLLACSEALEEIASVWQLAARCHNILQKLTKEERLHSLHGDGPMELGMSSSGTLLSGVPQATEHTSQNTSVSHQINSEFSQQRIFPNLLSRGGTPATSTHQESSNQQVLNADAAPGWNYDEDLYAMLNFDQEP